MTDARSDVLARIRRARETSSNIPKRYEAIARSYSHEANLDDSQRCDLFSQRLHDYGATVWRCADSEVAAVISNAAALRERTNLLIPSGFPRHWLPGSLVFTEDEQLSYDEMDRLGGALTSCALAIAETGTIVLRHTREEGRRALSLVPDYLLCIVRTSQVVGSVVEGIRLCAGWGRMPLTTISGPSATADIEMIRVKGVHGPRTLDVILAHAS